MLAWLPGPGLTWPQSTSPHSHLLIISLEPSSIVQTGLCKALAMGEAFPSPCPLPSFHTPLHRLHIVTCSIVTSSGKDPSPLVPHTRVDRVSLFLCYIHLQRTTYLSSRVQVNQPQPSNQICPPPVFINQVLCAHYHVHLFTCSVAVFFFKCINVYFSSFIEIGLTNTNCI